MRIITPGPNPFNHDHHFKVQINGVEDFVTKGAWRLVVKNVSDTTGQLDVWATDDQDFPEVVFTGASVAHSMKIGSPGCSASSVTVASFTTKTEWVDIDGSKQTDDIPPDDISDFSSDGPLRNGALKPDVAAPGAMIVSALSGKSSQARSDMIDDSHWVDLGTSMASPFVAGIAALLLQRNPNLDPVKFKDLLRANSKVPHKPAGTFDPKWGFGLIRSLGL